VGIKDKRSTMMLQGARDAVLVGLRRTPRCDARLQHTRGIPKLFAPKAISLLNQNLKRNVFSYVLFFPPELVLQNNLAYLEEEYGNA
jgi:hypothetical protein